MINDLIKIYKNYCKGRLSDLEFKYSEGTISIKDLGIPDTLTKAVFRDMDETKKVISNILFCGTFIKIKSTCDMDSYRVDFLKVLLGHKTIKDINPMFLPDSLANIHNR